MHSTRRARPLPLLGASLLALLANACEKQPAEAPPPTRPAASDQPLELVLPAWDASEPRPAHWRDEQGLSLAMREKKELELALEIRGGGPKSVIALLAFPADRPGAEPEPAWAKLVEVARGTTWRIEVSAENAVWQKVGGPRPLRVEIGAFAPAAYEKLEVLFEELSPADRRARWDALSATALQRRAVELYVVPQPPKLDLSIATIEGARLAAGPNGLRPALPLRVRTPFLQLLEVDGRAVPEDAWGAFPEAGSGEANERLVLVPWPERAGGFATSFPVRAVDRLGREVAVEAGAAPLAEGPRAPYVRDDVRLGSGGRLEGWVREGDPTRWVFEGQDDQGRPRLQHRHLVVGGAAILSFRLDAGAARVAELVHAHGVVPLVGASSTRRDLVAVPAKGGLVHFEIPLPEPEVDAARSSATVWCELRVWPRAVLADGSVPAQSGPRAALAASAQIETYHLVVFRDTTAPGLDAALGDGAKVAFPAQGDALLELGALCRFPWRISVAGRELDGPLDDSEWIDSGCSYVGKQRLSLQGRLVRGFALPWPRDGAGAPLLGVPVAIEDRLGRRSERTFRFERDDALPPLRALEPLRSRAPSGPAKPARLEFETTCGGGLAVPLFEWEVLRATDELRDAVLRRRVSVFPSETVRLRVAAPPGDYRVELLVLSGVFEKLENYADGVFAARGGEVVQVGFDLRSLGSRETSFGRTFARFALFRAEDRTDCRAPRGEALAELSARALDIVQIELLRDNAAPAILFDTPPGAVLNPLPDPARRRPPAALGVALLERHPIDLRFDGRAIALPDPLAIDAADPGGELFAREERCFAWDLPAREDGPQVLRIGVRDRTQRWREAELEVVYDRVAPALASARRELQADGSIELVLEASEELREATWSDPSGAASTSRFSVEGRVARARFAPAEAPRRGTLRLADAAGNAVELELSPDRD